MEEAAKQHGDKKVVVFTGAGIGVPLGLPTTTDFVEEVGTTALPVTTQLQGFLSLTETASAGHATGPESRSKDIEWILSSLEQFQQSANLISFMLPQLAGGHAHAQGATQFLQGQLGKYQKDAVRELRRLKQIIFRLLDKFDRAEARKYYLAIFRELGEYFGANASFALVTTNYDLTVDSALDPLLAYWKPLGIDGFTDGFRFDGRLVKYDPATSFEWKSNRVLYLKLHGSVDWQRSYDGWTKSGAGNTPDEPDRVGILYPGYKGVPEGEPFVSLHMRFDELLAEADEVIVVGFAFRDQFINNIFRRTLERRPDRKIYFYNPSPVESFPQDSIAPDLIARFDAFVHRPQGVRMTDTPSTWEAEECLHENSLEEERLSHCSDGERRQEDRAPDRRWPRSET